MLTANYDIQDCIIVIDITFYSSINMMYNMVLVLDTCTVNPLVHYIVLVININIRTKTHKP